MPEKNPFALRDDDPILQKYRAHIEAWEQLPPQYETTEITQPQEQRVNALLEAKQRLRQSIETLRSQLFAVALTEPAPLMGAAGDGNYPILVVNTASEISVSLTREPVVNQKGIVSMAVAFDPGVLPLNDAQIFYLDVVYLPTGETLLSTAIDAEKRLQLILLDGLTLEMRLPGFQGLPPDMPDQMHLPKTSFPLRIWWIRDR